jgi:hypothetical protein
MNLQVPHPPSPWLRSFSEKPMVVNDNKTTWAISSLLAPDSSAFLVCDITAPRGIGADGNTQIGKVLAFFIERPGLPADLSQLLEIFENIREVIGKLFMNFG